MDAGMTPRPWTAADRATLRQMAGAGYSDAEIARHLGRDRRTVCDTRARLGIRPGISPAVVAMMARLHRRRTQIAA
jgi:IS30 family transposase